jgi:hypothetical protein
MAALQLLLPPDQLNGVASDSLPYPAPMDNVASVGLTGLPAAFKIAAADVDALKLLPLPFGVAQGLDPPETESVRVVEGPLLPRLDINDDTRLLALRLMLALCARLLLLAGEGEVELASAAVLDATCHVTPLFLSSPEPAGFFLPLSIRSVGGGL